MEKKFIIINGIKFDENVIIMKYKNYLIIGDKFYRIKVDFDGSTFKQPFGVNKTKNMLMYYYHEQI